MFKLSYASVAWMDWTCLISQYSLSPDSLYPCNTYDYCIYKLNTASYLGVDAIGIVDFPINFLYTNAGGTSSMKVSHGMQTHITKALEIISQSSIIIIIT